MKAKIVIEPEACTKEEWYRGHVDWEGEHYPFFVVHTKELDTEREETTIVQWWFKKVPKEVRKLEQDIINNF